MLTVDARCAHPRCDEKNVYRMVGWCRNCGTKDILVLFSAKHETSERDCPVCGCYHSVRSVRLATEDEVPFA